MNNNQASLERERALRTEKHLKRAVKIATHFKDGFEGLQKENEELKKELAMLKKNHSSTSRDSIDGLKLRGLISHLDPNSKKVLKNALRKALHPDKHHSLTSELKKTLEVIFMIIERYFE